MLLGENGNGEEHRGFGRLWKSHCAVLHKAMSLSSGKNAVITFFSQSHKFFCSYGKIMFILCNFTLCDYFWNMTVTDQGVSV